MEQNWSPAAFVREKLELIGSGKGVCFGGNFWAILCQTLATDPRSDYPSVTCLLRQDFPDLGICCRGLWEAGVTAWFLGAPGREGL